MEENRQPKVKLDPVLSGFVRSMLADAGIRRGSRKFADYELGKRALAELDLQPDQYATAIKILSTWVKV